MKFFETLLSGLKAIILSHSYSKKDSDAKYLTKDKQAQPDWNEKNKQSPAYIKNKPNIDTIHEELIDNIPYEYPKNTIDVLTEVDGHLALVDANTLYTDCLVFAEYIYANGNACNRSFAQAREIVQNWLNAYSRTKYMPKPPILYEVRYRENTWSTSYFPMFVAHCIWCNYDNTRDEITCDFLIANGSGNQIQRVVMTNIGNITFDRRDVALTTDVNARFDSFLWKPVPEYIEVLRNNRMTFDGTQQQLSSVYSADISNKVLEGATVRISVKNVKYETTIVRDDADPTNGLYASITTDEGYEYIVYFYKDTMGIRTNETGSHWFSVSAYLSDKMPEILLPDAVVTEQYVDEAIANAIGGGGASSEFMTLVDSVNGLTYFISMEDGKLVSTCEAFNLEVVHLPIQTSYAIGDILNTEGMVVKATFADGTSGEVFSEQWNNIVISDSIVVLNYNQPTGLLTTSFEVTVVDITELTDDFEFTYNDDGTYNLESWNGTSDGTPSTEMNIPDNANIQI